MKKLLLLSMVFITVLVSGQSKLNPPFRKTTEFLKNKSQGQIIWTEDFNGGRWANTIKADEHNGYYYDGMAALPDGWSVFDNNDSACYWHWSNVGPRGAYTGSPGPFDPNTKFPDEMGGTIENGFFILESDFYNTYENGEAKPDSAFIKMDSYFQFGPVDLNSKTYVQIQINQSYRFCCGVTTHFALLQVSNNYNPQTPENATWQEFTLKGDGYMMNDFNGLFSVNITEAAGNQPQVYFRILQKGSSHYFWMIDDITISALPDNNMAVVDSWFDYIKPAGVPTDGYNPSYIFTGGYTKIPVQLANQFVSFRTAVENLGGVDQSFRIHVTINKDDHMVYDEYSETINDLGSGEVDTAIISTAFPTSGEGFYQVSGCVEMETVDANPADNYFDYSFEVNKILYSRVNEADTANFISCGTNDWIFGGNIGDVMAQLYDIPKNSGEVILSGMRFYLPHYASDSLYEERELIISGVYQVEASVWKCKVNDNNISDLELIASSYYSLSEQDLGNWVYMPFYNDENNVLPNSSEDYSILVGVQAYMIIVKKGYYQWLIGADPSAPKQPNRGGYCYLSETNEWIKSLRNYAIDFYVYSKDAKVNLTFKAQVLIAVSDEGFSPGTDTLYISGDMNNWTKPGDEGSIMLTDIDSEGFYTTTINVPANSSYTYNFYANSGWDGKESGSYKRFVEVGITDALKTDYVNFSSDITEQSREKISIFPNPFNNVVHVNNDGNLKSLSVYNLFGSEVFKINHIAKSQIIDMQKFRPGIYLLKVIDGHNRAHTIKINKE